MLKVQGGHRKTSLDRRRRAHRHGRACARGPSLVIPIRPVKSGHRRPSPEVDVVRQGPLLIAMVVGGRWVEVSVSRSCIQKQNRAPRPFAGRSPGTPEPAVLRHPAVERVRLRALGRGGPTCGGDSPVQDSDTSALSRRLRGRGRSRPPRRPDTDGVKPLTRKCVRTRIQG